MDAVFTGAILAPSQILSATFMRLGNQKIASMSSSGVTDKTLFKLAKAEFNKSGWMILHPRNALFRTVHHGFGQGVISAFVRWVVDRAEAPKNSALVA